jgi:adenosylcobinamide-GDP ribazoletransferase
LVGWLVGGLVGLVTVGANQLWPTPVAVILGLAAGVLVTGAFHEDGFADVCDGFGGGMNRSRTLAIMKDSRVGAFAVIGLVLLYAIKIATITALVGYGEWLAAATIVFANVASRWCVATMIFTGRYARDDDTSKIRPISRRISGGSLAIATIWLLPCGAMFTGEPWLLAALVPAFLTRIVMAAWFNHRLGGYTGDCLGAAQQVIATVMGLSILAALRFL